MLNQHSHEEYNGVAQLFQHLQAPFELQDQLDRDQQLVESLELVFQHAVELGCIVNNND